MAGLAVLLLFLISIRREYDKAEGTLADAFRESIRREAEGALYDCFVPMLALADGNAGGSSWLLRRQLAEVFPLWDYTTEQEYRLQLEEKYLSFEEVLLAEAEEGYIALEGEDAMGQTDGEQQIPAEQETDSQALTEQSTRDADLEALLQAENALAREQENSAATQGQIFIPHGKQAQIAMEPLLQYETLVQTFYTIDANTMAGSDQLDINKLLEKNMVISKEGEGPQILIYHTHSQEAFADSVPGDRTTSIVGVGERLTQILTEQYGYQVLHHQGEYDVASRDNAYAEALPAIEQVLAENPSVQVVIDLHRDSMAEETRLVTDLDGRPTARFMFFNGLSRTRKTGNISYLYNENQEDNLAFSFQMQLKAAEYYPGLTRKIYLKGYRYNMHLRPRTLLVELGAQNNTVEEAMNACDPLAHLLDMVLSGTE